MQTDPRNRRVIDAEFEVVDDGTGSAYGDVYSAPRFSTGRPTGLSGVPSPAVVLLGRLASGVLRGHEADAVSAAAIAGGFVRNPAQLRAVVEANEDALNAFFQQIDLAAVIDAALEPDDSPGPVQYGRAAVPLVGLGVLGGVLLAGILNPGDDADDN
jgi:hypothetical protein